MIENKIRVISNWKPENHRESEAMRSLVMTEMEVNRQSTSVLDQENQPPSYDTMNKNKPR